MRQYKQIGFFMMAALLAQVSFADPAMKVAVSDLDRAVNEVEEGAKAKTDLKKTFDTKQSQLDKKQEDLKKMHESIDKQRAVSKPEAMQAKEQEFQAKVMELQKTYVDMQQEMARKEQEAMAGIWQKMGVILETIRREGDYTFILNKTLNGVPVVLAAKPSLDVTNELIRRYNDSYPVKKKK